MAGISGKVTISTASMGVIRSKQGASLDIGGDKRTAVVDDQGVAGNSVETGVPSIDATFTDRSGVSAKGIQAIDGEDMTFETDNGKHYILREAWCTEPPVVSAGEIKAKFEGITCDEVSAG